MYSFYNRGIMSSQKPSPKTSKAEQAQAAFAQLLADVSRRGFYGNASLTFSVQDGSLQQLKVMLEKVIR